jgi:hypothetical protein
LAHGIGRTKGGRNTKLHAVCDEKGRPCVLLLTLGNVHDCKVAKLCIEAMPPSAELVADKGYDRQPLLVVRPTRATQAMCRSMLPENTAYSPFGHRQLAPQLIDTSLSPCGAQKFPCAASCKISLSRVRSEIARRSRRFSVPKSYIRRAWSVFNPAYSLRQR